MGERVHLTSEEIGIETAIQDVLNVIRYRELNGIVLVGHSFAGKVAAVVADREPDKVRKLLYLDGYSPDRVRAPQGSFPDEFPVDGPNVPFPEGFLGVVGKDIRGADREWLLSNATPCPVRYFRDPISLSERFDSVKEGYILCRGGDTLSWYLSQSHGTPGEDEALEAVLRGPFRIIDSGHYPMITKPEELVQDILLLAGRARL
jgi:pimeloyl-ACP methyl ester carboxylesterase